MESGATTRRFECPALPRGWIREEVYRCTSFQLHRHQHCHHQQSASSLNLISFRRGGLSIGKCDVYYIPPNGKKVNPKAPIFSTSVQVRSKPELIKLLGDTVDLSTFDYSTGTMNSTLIKPRGRMPKTAKDKVRPRPTLKYY